MMGHGADTVSKVKRINDEFSIDAYGVKAMFEQYYELKEMEMDRWAAVDIRIDFEQALKSTIMTAEARLMTGLVHGFGLTIMQASKLSGLKLTGAKEALDEAHEVVEAVLNGYTTTYFKTINSTATNIDEWISGVRSGHTMPYDIPDKVMKNMFNYLVSIKDKQALAIINPKPQENDNEDDKFGGYPFYDTSEKIENPSYKGQYNSFRDYDYFREQDRNRVLHFDAVPEAVVSRGARITGRRKVKDANFQEFRTGKGNVYDF